MFTVNTETFWGVKVVKSKFSETTILQASDFVPLNICYDVKYFVSVVLALFLLLMLLCILCHGSLSIKNPRV